MLRLGLIISAIVVVVDQITKWIVLERLHFSPEGCLEMRSSPPCGFIELSPFFDLQMVWNRGISFGFLRADSDLMRWGLVLLAFAISAVFMSWLRGAERRPTAIALGLVIGGALGNVIDRIRFGAVADFLDFNGLWFPWVFNVADAAITVGAILLGIELVFFTEAEPGMGTPWRQFRSRAAAHWVRLRRLLGRPGGSGG